MENMKLLDKEYSSEEKEVIVLDLLEAIKECLPLNKEGSPIGNLKVSVRFIPKEED